MRIVTWNVNGLRAVAAKDKSGMRDTGMQSVLETLDDDCDIDVLCLQETKCPSDLVVNVLESRFPFKTILASKTRKGYSGVAVFSKVKPVAVYDDFKENQEGRVLCVEFDKFYVINAYVPNSKPDLARLDYRVNVWEPAIRDYIKAFDQKKPVVYVADFNVAPTEIDLYAPKRNQKSHGFTIEERTAFQELLGTCNLVNSFRELYPRKIQYTWFSNFGKSREKNNGWLIDMMLVSRRLMSFVKDVVIMGEYMGSDHVPVFMDIRV